MPARQKPRWPSCTAWRALGEAPGDLRLLQQRPAGRRPGRRGRALPRPAPRPPALGTALPPRRRPPAGRLRGALRRLHLARLELRPLLPELVALVLAPPARDPPRRRLPLPPQLRRL